MCLNLPCKSKIVKDPSRIFKKEDGKLVAWKVFVDSYFDKKLLSNSRFCVAKECYESDRSNTELNNWEISMKEVNYGIHVYVKKPKIKISCEVVVKCLCDPKDFVAIEAKQPCREAVFTKVKLVCPKGYEFNSNKEIVLKNKNQASCLFIM